MSEGWIHTDLGAHIDLLTGYSFRSSEYSEDGQGIRLLRGDNVIQGAIRWDDARHWPEDRIDGLERYQLEAEDVVVALDRTWIKSGLKAATIQDADLPCMLVQRVARIRGTATLDQRFLAAIIQSYRFVEMVKSSKTETAVPHISPNDIREFVIALPHLSEQRKIAEILRNWDMAIKKTEQLIAAKERHFAATSHLLLTSRKRIKDFSEKWVLRRADEIFENTSHKGHLNEPLLSVTQERGVIPRDILEGRVTMPSGETGAFKLVEPGNFVISLRSFQGGLEHSNYRGLVSPAYTVLRKVVEIDERFFRHYFKSADFIKRLSVAVIGIRDGKQISFQDFCSIKLPFPPVDEQNAISSILDQAEGEIGLLRKYTEALKSQRRGLMQKLLTGEWRLQGDCHE